MTLLDVAALREHITTGLVDAALQRLLDDAEAEIVRYAGPVGSVVEIVRGGGSQLAVSRPIASITAIRERDDNYSPITVATDDWEQIGQFVLSRLRFGTNSVGFWRGPVRVTYEPVDDTATRKVVQVELVKIEIANNPALASETVGSWTQMFSSNSAWNPEMARASALSRLREPSLAVVGG